MTTKPATDSQFNYLRSLLAARSVEVTGVTDIDGLFTSLRAQGADTRLVSKMIDLVKGLPLAGGQVAAAPLRVNNYAGKCLTCGQAVAEREGRIQPKASGKGWDTLHLDGQCPVKAAAATPEVPAGRYALREGGVVKFYAVDHGKVGSKWEGFIFVSVQASDDFFPVRNREAREAILTAIAADPMGASILYGQELGECAFCLKALTRSYSAGMGYGPTCARKRDLPFDYAAYADSAKIKEAEGE